MSNYRPITWHYFVVATNTRRGKYGTARLVPFGSTPLDRSVSLVDSTHPQLYTVHIDLETDVAVQIEDIIAKALSSRAFFCDPDGHHTWTLSFAQ